MKTAKKPSKPRNSYLTAILFFALQRYDIFFNY